MRNAEVRECSTLNASQPLSRLAPADLSECFAAPALLVELLLESIVTPSQLLVLLAEFFLELVKAVILRVLGERCIVSVSRRDALLLSRNLTYPLAESLDFTLEPR